MKIVKSYIKFNESHQNNLFTDEEIDEIKDLFTDLTDDFHLTKLEDNNFDYFNIGENVNKDTYIYFLYNKSNQESDKDICTIILTIDLDNSSKDFPRVRKYIDDMSIRLKNINSYKTNVEHYGSYNGDDIISIKIEK